MLNYKKLEWYIQKYNIPTFKDTSAIGRYAAFVTRKTNDTICLWVTFNRVAKNQKIDPFICVECYMCGIGDREAKIVTSEEDPGQYFNDQMMMLQLEDLLQGKNAELVDYDSGRYTMSIVPHRKDWVRMDRI